MTTYREPSGQVGARVMAWAALGRDTRERLTAACAGEGAVPLLTRRPAWQPAAGPMAGLALVSSLLLGSVLTVGAVYEPALMQSAVGVGAAGVFGGAVATQGALAARSWWLRGRHRFAGGTYLFVRDLLVIRRKSVRIVPTSLLTGVEYMPGLSAHGRGHVELRFESGERHELPCDQETGHALADQIARLRASLDEASLSDDLATLERFDPLWAERPRWSDEGLAPAARRPLARPGDSLPSAVPRWLLSPWPSLAGVALLGMVTGAGSMALWSSNHERDELVRAIQQENVPLLSLLARSPDRRGVMARDALDTIALRSSDPEVVLERYRQSRSARLDDRAFEVAMASPSNTALWMYRSIGGQNRAAAEEELVRRTLAASTRAAFDAYRDHGGPSRPAIEEASGRLRLATALSSHDLRSLRTLSEDPALLAPVRDEARQAMRRAFADEDERLRARHPGPLGSLLRATLARQSVSVAPLRLVVRGEAPEAALHHGDLTVAIEDLDEVVRAQIAARLDATVPLELLRLEARGRSPAHRRDVLPGPNDTYVLADYRLVPAGHERVEAQVTLTVHAPGSLAVAPVTIRFASVNPAVRGEHLFADALTDALQASLDTAR